jgi:hypothetical protein
MIQGWRSSPEDSFTEDNTKKTPVYFRDVLVDFWANSGLWQMTSLPSAGVKRLTLL